MCSTWKWYHLLSVGGPLSFFPYSTVELAPWKCYSLEVRLENIHVNTCVPDAHICTARPAGSTSAHIMHHLLNLEWMKRMMKISHWSPAHIRVIFLPFLFFFSLLLLYLPSFDVFLCNDQEWQGYWIPMSKQFIQLRALLSVLVIQWTSSKWCCYLQR